MSTRIVHLTSVHSRFDVRIFTKECVTLASTGYEVFLVVADGNNDDIVNNVHIVDAGICTGNRLVRMTKTVNRVFAKALKIDGDIYHFHDPELFQIALKLKKLGKKVIFDSHEDYTEDILNKSWIPSVLRLFISFIYNRYEKRMVSRIDGVITATSKIRRRFEKYNVKTIDINNYPILIKNINKIFKKQDKTVVYIGAIGKYRGIVEMLNAIAPLDVKLILAGTFTTKEEFVLASSMDGWKKVDYRKQIPRSEIEPLLLQSIAGLVLFHPGPNHDDSQPNKLFEYMAAGLPVIASNFPLWKDIVEKNKCGVCVDPLKPADISKAIVFVINNPSEAENMGANGLKAIQNIYNWSIESRKLIDFYKTINE